MTERVDQLVGTIWSAASLLRNDVRAEEYGQILLPLIVLRRIDCLENLGLFRDITQNPDEADHRIVDMARRLPERLRGMIEGFDVPVIVRRLGAAGLSPAVMRQFEGLDLTRAKVPDTVMVEVFQELRTRFDDFHTGADGEYSTPPDVNALMAALLVAGTGEGASVREPIRIYDPVCGCGGSLAALRARLHGRDVRFFGQDVNRFSWAMSAAAVWMGGADPAGMAIGDTLADDRHAGETFDYLIAHPPMGLSWKHSQEAVQREAKEQRFSGRFGAGLPRTSDSSLLFVQHLVAHMRPPEAGGSRAAIVVSGSPLFNGSAGSGESEIRRWLVENGLLEGIVALPSGLLPHTGIACYLLLLSNRPSEVRRDVIFLDMRGSGTTLRKTVGSKHLYLADDHVTEVALRYHEGCQPRRASQTVSKVPRPSSGAGELRCIDAAEFGYQSVQIDRPLRVIYSFTPETVERLRRNRQVRQDPAADDLLSLAGSLIGKSWTTAQALADDLNERLGGPTRENRLTMLLAAAGVPSPDGEVRHDRSGRVAADPELRSFDRIPLTESIEDFLHREVLPTSSDAWVDPTTVKIGYQVPRHLLLESRWEGELGPLSRVARRIPPQSVPLEDRRGQPLLTANTLPTEKAADLPDAADNDRPLSRCIDGDVVGYPGRWRFLPEGFGEALTSLTVLRPLYGGRTLCEWLNAVGRNQDASWRSLSMDTPVPVDAIKDPGFTAVIKAVDAGREGMTRLAGNLFPEFPNIFSTPTGDLEEIQRVVRTRTAEAHLLTELVQPLNDPVWRAELSYPFHVAGLARHYRFTHQADSRKEAL